MGSNELTGGAIVYMSKNEGAAAERDEFKPVVQVADIRLVNTQNQNTDRYRLLLSDGEFSQQGMLATQHNGLVKSNLLQKGSIIRLNQFVCNVIQNRIIIIIIDLDVLLEKCDLIGAPKAYPAKTDGNPSSVPRSSAPGQPLNQPSVASHNPPSYSAASSFSCSSPRPNFGAVPAGAQVQSSGENFHAGTHSYGSSVSGNMNSGRYNPPNSLPVHTKQEFSSPPPRAPLNSHVRPPNPSYHQPSPVFANRGPIAKNEAAPRIIPIAALNPYQGRWTIKARVTAKSELRQYSNPRGEGKVFSFDLLDSDGGEIRVTCFNAAVDQFYHIIEPGRVYMISRGTLKPAQKNFNHLRNDHEIMLDSTSDVQPCYEDDRSIPQQQFHFRPISEIESLDNNSVVDLIAVVSSINPSSTIMRKNGTETQKRSLQLKDSSGRSVELTLWGNFCNAEGQTLQTMCDSGLFPVLAVKSGRVNDFNGKSVGTISTSQLFIDPDFPEVQELKAWFNTHGKTAPAISLSREAGVSRTDVRKTICQIKDEKLGTSEKPDWITISATLSFIKADNFCYTACPLMIGDRQCNKKVTNNGDGKWRCERCDQSVDECDYRYILQMQIQDHTGLTWVTAFQEAGEEIMGTSAKELYYMKHEEQDDEKFAEVVRAVMFTKYLLKLKVKEETFSDEQRVKSTVVRAEKINFPTESKYLLDILANSKEEGFGSLPPKSEGMPTPGLTTSGVGGSRETAKPATAATNYSGVSSSVAMSQVGGNQYGGGARYPSSSGMHASCGGCGSSAHISANCPSLMSVPAQSYGTGGNNKAASGGDECYKCNQPGHWAKDCPSAADAPPPAYGTNYGGGPAYGTNYGGGRSGECHKCHQPGHWARDCPGVANTATSGRYGTASKQYVGGF